MKQLNIKHLRIYMILLFLFLLAAGVGIPRLRYLSEASRLTKDTVRLARVPQPAHAGKRDGRLVGDTDRTEVCRLSWRAARHLLAGEQFRSGGDGKSVEEGEKEDRETVGDGILPGAPTFPPAVLSGTIWNIFRWRRKTRTEL